MSNAGTDAAPQPAPERLTIEALESASSVPHYLLAAARAAERWLPGQELTQAEFDRAVHAVQGQEVI